MTHINCSRRIVLLSLALALPLGRAQTASPEAGAAESDQVVQMSSFVVRTTQGLGYVDANAASALKTDQALLDIPQAVVVLTNDLITDIGSNTMSDTLQYAGVSDFYRGNTDVIRGTRAGNYIDDMIDRVATCRKSSGPIF
jgi:outer membrane receptor protein involved in Fe transport